MPEYFLRHDLNIKHGVHIQAWGETLIMSTRYSVRSIALIVLFIFSLCGSLTAYAGASPYSGLWKTDQDNFHTYNFSRTPEKGYWVEFNPGYGGTGKYSGPALAMSLNFRYRNSLFSLQQTTVQKEKNLKVPVFFFSDNNTATYVKNISLLYSRVHDETWGIWTYGAGITYGQGREKNTLDFFEAYGATVQAQAIWLPFGQYFGLGLQIFGNLNSKFNESNYGAAIVIALGRFS